MNAWPTRFHSCTIISNLPGIPRGPPWRANYVVSPLQKQRNPEFHGVIYHYSIGLPPRGRYHIDVDPTELCLKNHSIKGTLSGTLADITDTLDFAQRGQ